MTAVKRAKDWNELRRLIDAGETSLSCGTPANVPFRVHQWNIAPVNIDCCNPAGLACIRQKLLICKLLVVPDIFHVSYIHDRHVVLIVSLSPHLDFVDVGIGVEDAQALATALQSNTTLLSLDLSGMSYLHPFTGSVSIFLWFVIRLLDSRSLDIAYTLV